MTLCEAVSGSSLSAVFDIIDRSEMSDSDILSEFDATLFFFNSDRSSGDCNSRFLLEVAVVGVDVTFITIVSAYFVEQYTQKKI